MQESQFLNVEAKTVNQTNFPVNEARLRSNVSRHLLCRFLLSSLKKRRAASFSATSSATSPKFRNGIRNLPSYCDSFSRSLPPFFFRSFRRNVLRHVRVSGTQSACKMWNQIGSDYVDLCAVEPFREEGSSPA